MAKFTDVLIASFWSSSKFSPNNPYMSLPRSSPLLFSISWSIFAMVFSIVLTSASVILTPAALFNSKIFCNRAFSCAKRNRVLRSSELRIKSNSDASNACVWSNSINARCWFNSVVCFNTSASYLALISASDWRTSSANCLFCANSIARCCCNN